MKQKNLNKFFLWFVKLTGVIPALLFFKPKIYRVGEKSQLKKGMILVSNHKSLMDFVLYLIVFFGKTIRFLMAEVLFNKGKLFAHFLFAIGGIYVNRDACDLSFIDESVRQLHKKGNVAVFPEGRLPVGNKAFPFKPGVTFIAVKANAPILPVYTDGNYGLFKRARVVIGEPFNITDYIQGELNEKEYERLTLIIKEKTYALKEYINKYEKR